MTDILWLDVVLGLTMAIVSLGAPLALAFYLGYVLK